MVLTQVPPRTPDFNDEAAREQKTAAEQARAFISHRQTTLSKLQNTPLKLGGRGERRLKRKWREHLFRTYRYTLQR